MRPIPYQYNTRHHLPKIQKQEVNVGGGRDREDPTSMIP